MDQFIRYLAEEGLLGVADQRKLFLYDTGLLQMLWLKGLQREIIGSVFETAVFSELFKKYPANSVDYWRTNEEFSFKQV